jgi:anaerobic ribonucleoside-triphosphate reductase activating protein
MSIYPHISGVNYDSLVDGEGVRTTLYLSGCAHHCPGCHNAETWDENAGQELTEDMIDEIAWKIRERPFLTGVTLSGGDPLFDPKKTAALVTALRKRILIRNLWLYTGYTWEEIMADETLRQSLYDMQINVLVDGRFEQDKKDKRLRFCGSANQRLIDVPASLRSGQVVAWIDYSRR